MTAMCWTDRESGSRLLVVLEQGHGLARRLERNSEMLRGAMHLRIQTRDRRRDDRRGRASNLTRSTDRDRAVQIGLRERTIVHAIDERVLKNVVSRNRRTACPRRSGWPCRRRPWAWPRRSARYKGGLNRAQIREHKSLKAPFLAQNPLQQHGIGGNWDAIDLVVGGHHAHGVPLAQRRLKRLEHHWCAIRARRCARARCSFRPPAIRARQSAWARRPRCDR